MEKTLKEKIEEQYWIFFTIFLGIIIFLCFFNLGYLDVDNWDESRHGVNAYEMLKQGNYIANFYGGEIDYWNLKPPISYYFIMLGYKIFGYNAWGLRFFSALAFVATAIVVALFVKKKSGKFASIISLAMFSGFYIFFVSHYIRTGDADALFILFFALAVISLGLSSENANWLNLTGLMFALAFLTKSWHAFFFLPIIFFYWIFTKLWKQMKWWQYFTAVFCALAPIAIWVLFRYRFDGITFFKTMFEVDLLNRSSSPIEGHNGYPFYYTSRILMDAVQLVCSVIFIWKIVLKIKHKEKFNNLDKLCIISFLCVFCIFALAKSKYEWYTYPCAIPLVIAGSSYIEEIYNQVKKKKLFENIVCAILFLSTVASFVVVTIVQRPTELQTFISSFEIKNQTIYCEIDGNKTPEQNVLICTEWSTDSIICDGGFEKFLTNKNSYIIMKKIDFDAYEKNEYIVIFDESENYVLCYNSMQMGII